MQPENPNQTPQSSPGGGLNIPDYLRSEPQPARSNKAKGIIFVVISIIVLAMVAITVTYVSAWLQGEPERKFYQALGNLMQTSYVARDYEFTRSDTDAVSTIKVQSDFSNVTKPKSAAKYDYAETAVGSGALRGEVVVLGGQDMYVRIQEAPIKKLELDEWQKTSELSAGNLDYSELEFLINNPLDRLVTGNFSDDTKTKLLQIAEQKAIYNLKETTSVQLAGKSATLYKVEITRNNYVSFNNQAAELAGMESPYVSPYSKNNKLTFLLWVDDATETVARFVYEEKTEDVTAKTTIDYNYPGKVNIANPIKSEAN